MTTGAIREGWKLNEDEEKSCVINSENGAPWAMPRARGDDQNGGSSGEEEGMREACHASSASMNQRPAATPVSPGALDSWKSKSRVETRTRSTSIGDADGKGRGAAAAAIGAGEGERTGSPNRSA